MITYGLLTEEIGRGCSSVRSLLTVHDMVAHAIQRWGSPAQQRALPAGAWRAARSWAPSPSPSPRPAATPRASRRPPCDDGDAWVLDGRKKWTTYGQLAGLFLVFAQADGKPTAFLVERDTPGVAVRPLRGITGTRASMLAEIFFDGCRVPKENLLGRPGFGVSHVDLRRAGAWALQRRLGLASASARPASTPAAPTPPSAGSSACRSPSTSSSAACSPT